MTFIANSVLKKRIQFIIQCWLLVQNVNCVIANTEIDFNINDILNTQMMPLHVFFDRFNERIGQKYTSDFLSVVHTMSYHRKMMQEYMASNYLSKQIMNWKVKSNESNIKKRIGKFQNTSNIYSNDFNITHSPMEAAKALLYDDGSTKYNAWLKRTTTLDDIQHQLNSAVQNIKNNNQIPIRRQIMASDTNSTYLGDEDIDYGDITGYAYDSSYNDSKYFNGFPYKVTQMPRLYLKNPNLGVQFKPMSKTGYETAADDYRHHSHSEVSTNTMSHPVNQIREISIKDITDIALTTLAFLSFGMFFLQVLMCITMTKEDGSNLMMMPMEGTEPPDPVDGTEEIRRRKRSVQHSPSMLAGINQLTQNLMTIIDHLYLGENKNSNMKYNFQLLCGYAANDTNGSYNQRLWTTLYSLGSSWLATRLSNDYFSTIKHIAYVLEVCT